MPQFLSASLRLCAILLVAASTAAADEPLTWKWSVGDSVRYEMKQAMRMTVQAGPAGEVKTSMLQEMLMDWDVESVAADGAATLRQQAERIRMENEGVAGQGFEYDSDSEDPPTGMATLIAPVFDAMIEHPFLVTMLPTGEVTETKFSDELKTALDRMPGGAASGDMIQQMCQQSMLKFPEEPLAVGDKWTTTTDIKAAPIGGMKVMMTCVYEGPREVEGHTYEAFTPSIDLQMGEAPGQMRMEVETKESTGEILFDREKGRIFRSRMVQSMEIHMAIGEQNVVNAMEQVIELREIVKDEAPATAREAAEEPAVTE